MKVSIPRWGWITLGVAVVLTIAVAVPYHRMMTDDLAGKYNPAPSQELLTPAAKAMLTGEPATFTQDEINSFAAYHLPDIRNYLQNSDFQPNQVYLTFPQEDIVSAYTPVTWRGKSLGITSQSRVTAEIEKKQLVIEVQQVRLGRLSVSPNFALNRMFRKGVPDGMTRDGNTITVDLTPYLTSEQAQQAGFSLEQLRVQQGGVLFQAESTLSASRWKDQLKDWLGKTFTGELGDELGGLADQLQKYLKNSATGGKTLDFSYRFLYNSNL